MATTLAKISIKDNSSWNTYLNLIYPVGSVYISYTSTSPATRFGGTWSAITGRFPYFNAGTKTDGSNTHTHDVSNAYALLNIQSQVTDQASILIGRKSKSWSSSGGTLLNFMGGQFARIVDGVVGTQSRATALAGSTKSSSTMPAYQTLYAWRRTA